MAPKRRGRSHFIQSNRSGKGSSSHKSKRQECQLREEAQMEDAKDSTCTFQTIIDSPESEITAIPVVRYEQLPTSRSRNIPVSVQELAYGSKAAGVGTSSQLFDGEMNSYLQVNKLLGPKRNNNF
ncbi:hypothetical protein O181_094253 [Austropuccinia psidii MF-1]|uniref:Uncharacterized protein n=1 Tax=Austropuccinia psidii MF-1 TaxID=1389203 RepID=A0A9Q3PA42_9BASI|nr:hypothetical protein [Austropuccinia psidii MF-1]